MSIMSVFETMTVYDYGTAILGIVAVILGISQLCTKKCIGILNIDNYTETSTRKFAIVSGVIYLIGGIVTAVAPFGVIYLNSQNIDFCLSSNNLFWILIAVVAIVMIAQVSMLKKKI